MPSRATVVLTSFTSTHRRTLESLDRQSLHVSGFDVVVVDDGADPEALRRITELVRNRPNVRHLAVDPGTSRGSRRNAGLAAATGDYVLILDDGTVLWDESLARLTAYADETGADICLGRTSDPGRQTGAQRVFGENTSRAKVDDVVEAFEAGRIYRRSFLEESGLRFATDSDTAHDLGFDLEAISRTDAISVLATCPAFSRVNPLRLTGAGDRARSIASCHAPDDLRDRALLVNHRRSLGLLVRSSHLDRELAAYRDVVNEHVPDRLDERLAGTHQLLSAAVRTGDRDSVERMAADPGSRPRVRNASLGWREGALDLALDLEEAPTESVRVALFRRSDGLEWALEDGDVQVDKAADSAGVHVSARVRPDRLAGDGALATGVWLAVVIASVGEVEHRLRVPLPKKAPPDSSYVEGVPVVCFSEGGRLAIDVGAMSHPVISQLSPDEATVVEDARGSLLRVPLSHVEMPAGGSVDGQLKIGGLPVPARISVEDGTPVLRAWVSGLPGSYPLSTTFSSAPFARTGLVLEIAGVGTMTLRKASPRKPPAKKRPAHTPAPSQLRKALKRVPGSRAIYRRLRSAAPR